jgi:hypothetical protein
MGSDEYITTLSELCKLVGLAPNIGMAVNNDLKWVLKEVVAAYFKLTTTKIDRRDREKQGRSQLWWSIPGLRFKSGTSRIRMNAKHSIATSSTHLR